MAASSDTPLGALINRQISETGPLPLSVYMQLCLTHPEHGYYNRPTSIGRQGDFVTAPEVSQIFGETLGVFAALVAGQISDGRFDLVELGPGRGTLMADLWRSLARLAPAAQPGGPILVEISNSLRAAQAYTLAALHPSWLGHVEDLADAGPPLVIIANEFFDVLPIRQYQKTATGWHERVVGLTDGTRSFGLNPTPIAGTALPAAVRGAPEHARFETRPAAAALMDIVCDKLARRGGVLLALDYGYGESQAGDTFQAVAGHAFADPLAAPGTADLTAHVDFEALGASAGNLEVFPLLTQARLLMALGAGKRADALKKANPARADAIAADLARLTDANEMGEIFKAFCVSSAGLSPYPFISQSDQRSSTRTDKEGSRAGKALDMDSTSERVDGSGKPARAFGESE